MYNIIVLNGINFLSGFDIGGLKAMILGGEGLHRVSFTDILSGGVETVLLDGNGQVVGQLSERARTVDLSPGQGNRKKILEL